MNKLTVGLQLPGRVIETSGSQEGGANVLAWNVNQCELERLYAVSSSPDWLVIGGIAAIVVFGGVLIAAGVRAAARRRAADTSQGAAARTPDPAAVVGRLVDRLGGPTSDGAIDPRAALPSAGDGAAPASGEGDLGAGPGSPGASRARELLEDVNRHVLQGAGSIEEAHGQVALVWTSAAGDGRQMAIRVRFVDRDTVTVNGIVTHPSSEGIQRAIAGAMRRLQGLS